MTDPRILVACMPKSGSTYLSEIIAGFPGLRRVRLVPGYQRREQELGVPQIEQEILKTALLRDLWRQNRESLGGQRPRGFVSQMHIRYTEPTDTILREYGITPVVLVRDIFDIVVSLRDHIVQTSPFMSMAFVSEDMREWPEERMYRFLADMAVPWYLNFFVSWTHCPDRLLVTYEQLVDDTEGVIAEVAEATGLGRNRATVREAIDRASGQKTRRNKGVTGRGAQLPEDVRDTISRYAAYYPDVDLSPMGL